ncbi:hypothetical protein FBY06_11575 [Pseudomonas sp. SJZ085]|uniref:hypothetical protein n=1 Tax=unclassified Pseudomonas TaxID=196821 RepID=UPI00119C1017|nr:MULTISPECIES: hypothetical protein [unclassified Pseudomonas]TWC18150.1 hypothetical protein FBX99_11575 [Pseudomonas sp. SJZ074]TWC36122.1 hypothetical protein FBY06_11575 [Pseudomonas sp. SJZ085]
MSKHTPGPWRIGNHSSEVIAEMPADPPFRGMTENCVKHYGGYLIAESCAAEDAKLIAAAPEMLEALTKCLALKGTLELHGLLEQVEKAIAKATQ